MTERLLDAGEIESFEQWNPWTAEVVSLFLRTAEVAESCGWNESTPGFTDVLRELQNLLDRWFQQSDGVMQDFADKCIQGELEYVIKVKLFREVAYWFDSRLDLERDEVLENWSEVEGTCFDLTITWQANVVTTAQGFTSDISLGSELQTQGFSRKTDLEVEYIEGFWEDTCEGTSGTVELAFEILWDRLNLDGGYLDFNNYISSITAYVSMIEPVYIDCSPSGFEITADAQAAFHGGALEELNRQRLDGRGRWAFAIEYDPGGGVVGQFEQGPENLSWSEGEYKLWQLVTIYQSTQVE